jgi:formylmethanofuran dehydrogenase subunit E
MRDASRIARHSAARFVPGLNRTVQCSACGRPKAETTHMVAGPNVYLCDRCFQQAARQLAPRRVPPDAVHCQFCRQLRAKQETTVVGGVTLCADCLGRIEMILAEAEQPSRADA